MNTAIKICTPCHTYTLQDTCVCSQQTLPALPPRFSPDDRHAHLIRQAKEIGRQQRGLL